VDNGPITLLITMNACRSHVGYMQVTCRLHAGHM